ncbi:hypothetical protein ACJX0J_037030, partial [Zea mays]
TAILINSYVVHKNYYMEYIFQRNAKMNRIIIFFFSVAYKKIGFMRIGGNSMPFGFILWGTSNDQC